MVANGRNCEHLSFDVTPKMGNMDDIYVRHSKDEMIILSITIEE